MSAQDVHPQASRNRAVLLVGNRVQVSIVNIVHAHDCRGCFRGFKYGGGNARRGFGNGGGYQALVSGSDGAGDNCSPTLSVGENRVLSDQRRVVQLQVFGVIGKRVDECVHESCFPEVLGTRYEISTSYLE